MVSICNLSVGVFPPGLKYVTKFCQINIQIRCKSTFMSRFLSIFITIISPKSYSVDRGCLRRGGQCTWSYSNRLRVISLRNVWPIDSSKPWHHIHNPCPPAMCVCIMAPSRPVHHLLDVNIPSLCQLSHSPILPFNFAYTPLKILEYISLAKFRVNFL